MFKLELINDQNMENMNIFENIDVNFSNSIKYNKNIVTTLQEAYKRTLNNQGKFLLGFFHLNIFDVVETITKNTNESSDFLEDLTDFISTFFKEINDKLNIRNIDDLNNLMFILNITSILLENALEDNDIDMIYEVFFQIESRIKKDNLITSDIIYKSDDDSLIIEISHDMKELSRDDFQLNLF